MGQRHKHADVIIAWANGKDIQVRHRVTGEWLDLTVSSPSFNDEEYRVKPKVVIQRGRVALMRDGSRNFIRTSPTELHALKAEGHPCFVRWLTDWIEYEVEE